MSGSLPSAHCALRVMCVALILLFVGCRRTGTPQTSDLDAKVHHALHLLESCDTYAEGKQILRDLGAPAVKKLRILGDPTAEDPTRAWPGLIAIGDKAAFEALLDCRRRAKDEWHRYALTRVVWMFLRENQWTTKDIDSVAGAREDIVSWIDAEDGPPDVLIHLIRHLRYRSATALALLRRYAKDRHDDRIRELASRTLVLLEQSHQP